MRHDNRRSRRPYPAIGCIAAALVVVLAACTPEPPPTPPPPTTTTTTTTTTPSRPECGSGASAASGTAITVEAANGARKVVEVPEGGDIEAKRRALRANSQRVVDVEPEVAVSVAQSDADVDDPFFDAGAPSGPQLGQWGLKAINAPEAWGSVPLNQGQGVKVAVIDTGVQGDHPGLLGRVAPGIDLVVGLPFDGRVDGDGHGTHVAGIIAEIDDTAGGVGVAPSATIVPVRVLDCDGDGTSIDVANGIYYAVDDAHADVINLSLGTDAQNDTILLAVEHALANGVTVVAASGNAGSSSCPPNTPVTTTTSSSTTPASTSPPASTPTSTTSPPVSTPDAEAPSRPPSTTSTSSSPTGAGGTVPAPTPSTSALPPPSSVVEPGSEPGPTSGEAVTIAACTVVPTYSSPLYPAGYAIGRPGLIAVAATGANVGLLPPGGVSGTITWHAAIGEFLEQGDTIATIGSTSVVVGEAGVLVAKNVSSGAVGPSQQFATMLSTVRRAAYSNVSDYNTVAAPGGGSTANSGIFATLPGSTYGYKSGTSMATPHVAAIAALRLTKCGTNTPAAAVANAIVSTAFDIGEPGWDPAFGAGIVRADAVVAASC